jgi:hypothetical protein
MSSKRTKVTVKVITDGIQVDGRWYHNGMVFQVSEAKAKALLKSGTVEKA